MTSRPVPTNYTASVNDARATAPEAPSQALDVGTVVVAFGLLGHWWSRPVPGEIAAWRANARVEADVFAAMGATRELAGGRYDPRGLIDEYERLFVGPGPVPCPPYESYWRDDVEVDLRRSLMGPCTAELRSIYEQLGLEVKPSSGELPDHLAIELEAISYALTLDGHEEAVHALFFAHVRKWLPRFCRAVVHETEHPFYQDLARGTSNWLPAFEAYLAAGAISATAR